MSLPDPELLALFGPQGPLRHAAPGYRERPGQVALAQAIAQTLDTSGCLVAEAGTGVGKTFAYLVPLLRHAGKTVISTATRHLQDQLYARDLPKVKAALGVSIQTAILKGRSNYLCLYRLEQHQVEGRFHRREDIAAFREIVRFAATTKHGDIAECDAVPESSPVWASATSTRENCLGQQCPRLADCHVMAARQRAADADLLVVNHHLLCADMALRDEGFGELLPTVNHVVIDEAHALPDIATGFFGQSVSTQSLSHLARDLLASGLTHARDGAAWPELCGQMETAAAEIRLLVPSQPAMDRRIAWESLSASDQGRWKEQLQRAVDRLGDVRAALEINAERHLELAQALARTEDLIARLMLFARDASDEPAVRWIEVNRYSLVLHVTPYDISDRFRHEMAKRPRAWVFVSATLAVGGRFQHFQERLGLESAETLVAQSPFDFQTQGLLLVPEQSPDPKASDLMTQLLAQGEIQALIAKCPGGLFVLCTSHRAVNLAQQWFQRWAQEHTDRMVLVQGEAPRHQLIDRFRTHGKAVLIGSHSFWEGVDVPGQALSMVLIDKIPFAPPDDPVLEARAKQMTRQGRDAFMSLSVPEAAILLKQGVGRLIRTETDRGLVVIGDRRLAETPYGRRIIQSLPGFQRTRDAGVALRWLTSPELESAERG